MSTPGSMSPAAMWGAMLKHYRELAGHTQESFGKLVGYTTSHIGSLETGRRKPDEKIARRFDEALGTKGALIRLYDMFLGHTGFKPGFLEWTELEAKATMIRGFESVLVPGLLQTAEYARVALELDGEEAVVARLARQEIFSRDDPPVVRFVIDEWVLRRPVGDAGVMRRQLEHIEEMMTSGKVYVHVLRSGVLPGISGSFSLATVDGRTVGCEDTATRTEVLIGEHELHWLEVFWDRILTEAETPARSLELIREIKEELWTS